jgi:Tfp pilus assembly ATPase PilU
MSRIVRDLPTPYVPIIKTIISLIILRGPAGAGKTTVSEVLVEKIDKNDVCVLDLDITDSDDQSFNENLEDCLRYNSVIVIMFYGNSHTTDPMRWIVNFKDAGYNILSVILFCSKVMCFDRCIDDNYTGHILLIKKKIV